MSDLDIHQRHTQKLPVNVYGLAGDLGLRVSTHNIAESGRMQLICGTWCILINIHLTPAQQKFTLAHMIGHYLLHRDLMENGLHIDKLFGDEAKTNPSYPLEPKHDEQANRIAADILMPAPLMREHKALPLKELSAKFGIPEQPLKIRREHLGLPET